MIKNNKKAAIISSIIILLPILIGLVYWNQLPDVMVSHWDASGNPNGFTSKAFSVFIIPLILLAIHWICLYVMSTKERYSQISSQKIMNLIFCIIPFISLFMNGVVYYISLVDNVPKGKMVISLIGVLLGIMFIVIGNYMPKAEQNRYFGYKISWTLANKENWNKTHRFGGAATLVCGILMLLSITLPFKAAIVVMGCVLFSAIFIPFFYSFAIFLRHKKEGIKYDFKYNSKKERAAGIGAVVIVCLVLIGVGILMFTGDVTVSCGDASFVIDSTYYDELEVKYTEIDEITYRDDLDIGYRTYGFNSAKLSLGNFNNDEFGDYTIYVYNGCDSYIVARKGENYLVFNCETEEKTLETYNRILLKIEK